MFGWHLDRELVSSGIVKTVNIAGAGIGGVLSYGSENEVFGFEGFATIAGVTGYLAGDQDDMTQDAGANYVTELGGLGLEAGVNYNFDNEEFSPKVVASFSF